MRYLLLFLVAALIGGAIFALRPAANESVTDEAAIDAIMHAAQRSWHVPGAALAVVRDDQLIYLKGFGVRELGKPEPVTPDTLFPLASCTKAFTTAAMAMLVGDGKMDWDDPVRRHVPYFHLSDPLADAAVTLRDLVSHRSGLGANDLLWYRAPWSREETIRRIGHVKLKYSFRSTFQYQTTMFTTAGQAVELTSGMKWEDFVRRRIFEPLNMTHANFTTTAVAQVPDHASPHRRDASANIQVIPWYRIEHPEPAGSINASARELANWLRFQLGDGTFEGKRLVSAAALHETHMPQTIIRLEGQTRDMNPDTHLMCYGMAWVLQDYRGHGLVSHAGIIDGFRAHITLVPEARLGLVLLNNLDRTTMNLAASNSILDHFLELPKRDWNAYLAEQVRKGEDAARDRAQKLQAERRPSTRPSHDGTSYAGSYEDPAYGVVEVSFRNGRLFWHWNSFSGELEHYQDDTFILGDELLGHPLVTFVLGAGGDVVAMTVAEPLGATFKKIERQ